MSGANQTVLSARRWARCSKGEPGDNCIVLSATPTTRTHPVKVPAGTVTASSVCSIRRFIGAAQVFSAVSNLCFLWHPNLVCHRQAFPVPNGLLKKQLGLPGTRK